MQHSYTFYYHTSLYLIDLRTVNIIIVDHVATELQFYGLHTDINNCKLTAIAL